MTTRVPGVLCPVDFSDASRVALRYAAAIADHFGARLIVLTVDDPFLAEVAANAGYRPFLEAEMERELERFCADALQQMAAGPKSLQFRVAVGKPAAEILREAKELDADLIVISSQGRSGVRKVFFGSTTERVLRETAVPVLITPSQPMAATSLADIAGYVRRVIAPLDLTAESAHQVTVAAGIAEALSVPLIIAHVLEPILVPLGVRATIPGIDAERRAHADERLSEAKASVAQRVETESIVVAGEPSEEIVKLAKTRRANLIVMGLHSSGLQGPRMGSVTYRVLCLARSLVLALPPETVLSGARRAAALEYETV